MYNKEYYEKIKKYETYNKGLYRWYLRVKGNKSVLDVGCGNGYLVEYLRERGIQALGLDFSEYAGTTTQYFVQHDATQGLPFDDETFDVVISSDFFEHLPEDKIDFVKNEMLRVGKKVIALVGTKNEKIDNTHLTIKKKSWWKEKLKGILVI
jgi:SAM-dependent methyltransferase